MVTSYSTAPSAGTVIRFHRDPLAFNDRDARSHVANASLLLGRNGALYHCTADATPADPSPQWRACLTCAIALLYNSAEADELPAVLRRKR